MIKEIVKKLIEKKISVTVAESITGGLVAKCITDVPNSSTILKESYVVYSNEAKIRILGVDNKLIEKYGVVSSEVAYDMVKKLYDISGKDICISTTGNAGPSVCDDKPVGRVYIGIKYKDNIKTFECNFITKGNDEEIRNYIRVETVKKIFEEIDKMIM